MENKGQIIDQYHKTNTSVLYQLALPGLNVSLKKDGFSYDTWMAEDLGEDQHLKDILAMRCKPVPHKYNCKFHRIDVNFIGANPLCQIEALDRTSDYTMYYTTGTPEEGAKVHQYGKVLYRNLYPNIDLEFVAAPSTNKPVEYNFIVHPGADVARIKMRYTGASDAQLINGELRLQLVHTRLTENIPASWIAETKQPMLVNYKQIMQDQQSITIGFTANNFNHNNTLIIDPTPNLNWESFNGSGGITQGEDIALDAFGNVVVTGLTSSIDNIATTGVYQTIFGGEYDAFVLKFNTSGALQWGTYFGGDGDEWGYGIATDASGNIFVTGRTASSSGIASTNGTVHQPTLGGSSDAFIVAFNESGGRVWGTYYGGLSSDEAYDIACDASGHTYITGRTASSSGIVTPILGDTLVYGGAFIARFSSFGTRQWSKYYGYGVDGSNSDCMGFGISLDPSGNILVTGRADNYCINISTGSAHQVSNGGYYDAFVAKFTSLGDRLWGTYYGGVSADFGNDIATDASGNVFVTGTTSSINNIATPSAHQDTLGGDPNAVASVFVVKFNSNGVRQWGTYYGSAGISQGRGIACDPSGNVLVTGLGQGNGFATPGAYQVTPPQSNAFGFIAKLNPSGARIWGTYYGYDGIYDGIGVTYGSDLVSDASGNVFITGRSTDSQVYTSSFSSGSCTNPPSVSINTTQTSCGLPNGSLTASASGGTLPYSYLWSNGATIATVSNLSASTYGLTVTDNNGCTASSTNIINTSVCPKVNSQSNITSITQNGATVTWPALSCAAKYRVIVKNVSTGLQTTSIVSAPNTTLNLTNLQPNTNYQVRIRTQCSQNGTVLSQTSPITSFTTLNSLGIQCLPPGNIGSNVISATSVQINWTAAVGAIQYNLRYRIIGSTTWFTALLNSSLTGQTLINLTPASTYEYQIRTKCNNNPNEFSPYSALYTFTTAPLRIEEELSSLNTILYPNPTSSNINLIINSSTETTATITISDILGRVLQTETEELINGTNTITYNISNFAAGMYLIRISNGTETTTLKMVKE